MDSELNDFKQKIQQTISLLKEDFKGIRTGRATPSLLEGIIVEAYGGQTRLRLMDLATITTDGSSLLIIAPFDPATAKDIEKAIQVSPLGLTPAVQGTRINVRIPPLSAEQREKMIKLISQKIEERKVAIRNMRDDLRKKLKHQKENSEITEDDLFRMEKNIDTLTQESMEEIQTVREKKEIEIKEV